MKRPYRNGGRITRRRRRRVLNCPREWNARQWRGTDLVITYRKGPRPDLDRAINKAIGKYDTGSGMSLIDGARDHTATVPDDDFDRVLRALKKIEGITIKKCVVKWVRC